jgi:predicted adenine nucleotide alpha hydrolase (AANH) superfamily ATPase
MVVHICCSVDSHYFLKKLREKYPKTSLRGFFYNPNIHPESEYKLRLMDVQKSCKEYQIELDEGEYKLAQWQEAVKGYEHFPEKGKRCVICFEERLKETAKHALSLGEKEITTTLLMSPQKSFAQLEDAAKKIEQAYNVRFIWEDFRSGGGTQAQFALSKKARLYHQNYCGCVYALLPQRAAQNKPATEMFEPINKQIQPGSIQERIALYKKDQLKRRQGFLNYRLLSARVSQKEKTVPAYILFYSLPNRTRISGRFEVIEDGIAWCSKGPMIAMDLNFFNNLAGTNFKSITNLLNSPLDVDEELRIREKIEGNIYSLTPIIIMQNLPKEKILFECKAQIFHDVRELLARV